ncbi:MAG: hypothetical protein RJA90_341, partial [Bacteroidota bacterium]
MMLFIRLNIVLFVCLYAHFQLRAQEADYVPKQWFNSLALEKKATGISAVKMLSEPLNIYQLNINPSLVSENEALRFLRQQPNIRFVQRNHYIKLRSVIPNDSLFSQQYYLQNKGQNGGLVGLDIKAVEAWNVTQGG